MFPKTSGLIWALAFGCALAARSDVTAAGEFGLHPGDVAVREMEGTRLCVDETPASQPAEAPASQPTTAPTSQPSAWPPGLLQDVLDAVGLKKPMKDLGIRAYGYVDMGFTGLLHGGPSRQIRPLKPLPLRLFESRNYNNLLLNQLKFTLERPIDTSKNFDFGARGDFIYGSDARYIHSYGLLDQLGEGPPPPERALGPFREREAPDLEQAYAEMWIRTGAPGTGLDVIFGKWITNMGAEVIDAPGNFLYSHSMLFGFAIPFTHTGVKATYNFDPTKSVYFAAVRGWDTFKDNNQGASWMWGGTWSSKKQVGSNPKSQVVLNMMAGPEQFSSPRAAIAAGLTPPLNPHRMPGNRYLIDAVWTYRYTEKLTQVLNGDFGYEEDVNGSINHEGVIAKRDSSWYGLAYYLNYVFNDYVNATGRAEWFCDQYGARTGFQGNFYEITTGVQLTPFPKDKYLKNLSFRPELRWDWSANNEPFAGKRIHDTWQMTAAIDMIYKF